MFRSRNRAAGRNYPAGTWNYHGQRRFLPRSLLTAKPRGPLAFSWYSVSLPPGYSGHNKVTTHFLTDNTTGICVCIISTSGLWQCFKNVLKSNKTTKSVSIKHSRHVLLALGTLSNSTGNFYNRLMHSPLPSPYNSSTGMTESCWIGKSQSFGCHFWPLGLEPCGFTTQDFNRLSFPGLLMRKMLHEWIRYSSSATPFTLLRI